MLTTSQICFAEEYRILVLPDNLQFESTNYYVYPDSSTMFASDIVDALNHAGKVKTVSMGDVRDNFRKDLKLRLTAKNVLKEFKYNFNVCFVDLKTVAHAFYNKVLMITSTTDVQNFLFKRTIWDIINLPGEPTIMPTYSLATYAVLVDVDSEKVLWQKQYQKEISALEGRILAVNFAPAIQQLERIKNYSDIISPQIARIIESKIVPSTVTSVKADIITTEIKNSNVPPVQSILETEIKTKTIYTDKT